MPPATPANPTWTPVRSPGPIRLRATRCCRKPSPTPARRPASRGDTFPPAAFISGAKIARGGRDHRGKGPDPARLAGAAWTNRPRPSTVSPKRTSRIFRFAGRRAVFTAAPRRWARRRSPASARVTSGACGFRSTNSTTSRNYLSKVQRYAKVYDNVNSISHRADFVKACLDLWELRAPFGIYNVTNPGFVTTRQVVEMIEKILRPTRKFEFWENDEEFYRVAAKTPRSNCVLDISKLLAAGVKIRPVHGGPGRFAAETGNRNNLEPQLDHEPAHHRRRRLHRLQPDPPRHRPARNQHASSISIA